jgi:hypothetical protein
VRKLFGEHGKVHRPVSEEVHLSAVGSRREFWCGGSSRCI